MKRNAEMGLFTKPSGLAFGKNEVLPGGDGSQQLT
jgi:hypothetical protein